MDTLYSFLPVFHVITAILMAWPAYALVVVNQRVRLGPPLGDRADTYMENIIKNRTIPCFVFQATALLTGLALVLVGGFSLGTLVSNPVLGVKLLLLLLIGGMLTYAHLGIQPRIDALFAEHARAGTGPDAARAGSAPDAARAGTAPDAAQSGPSEVASEIGSLRLRRKRMASVCMFVVLIESMLGVQVWTQFPGWLTALLVAALALFTWRTYSSVTRFGWL